MASATANPATLSALDESGKPVDRWFIYKVAGQAQSSGKARPTGLDYVYFDSKSRSLAGSGRGAA